MVNILLADDDADDRLFFGEALMETKIEHHLDTFENGVELMKFIQESPKPGILFLDINMPLKSGLECLFEIRREHKIEGLEIVIFSTSGAEETVTKSYRFGASLYIQKPSDYKKLVKMIEFVVANPTRRERKKFFMSCREDCFKC